MKCKINSIEKVKNISNDSSQFKVKLECNGIERSKFDLINKLKNKNFEIE